MILNFKFNLLLFIKGNENDAQNEELLIKEGITHVINCTKNIPSHFERKLNYLRVAVNDGCDQDIKSYFAQTNKFIDDVKKSNGKVLVHCQAGISRSPTIVIAYLIKSKNLSLQTAYAQVKKIRSIIEPNFLFYSQLDAFSNEKL